MRASWGRGAGPTGVGCGRPGQRDAQLQLGEAPGPGGRRGGRHHAGVQRDVHADAVQRRAQAPGHVLGVGAAPVALAVAFGQHVGQHRPPSMVERLERGAQGLGVHRLAPRVDPHAPAVAVGPSLQVQVGGQALGRVGVAVRDLLELVELLAGQLGERLGDDVVLGPEVVVQQAQAGSRLAGDLAHGRVGEPAPADHAPGGVEQLRAPRVRPGRARGGAGAAHPAATCSPSVGAAGATAAGVPAGTASSRLRTRRWRAGRCTRDGVARLVLDLLVVVGHVGLDERPGHQAHAHLLVEAEVDDLLDHPRHAVLAGGAVRLEADVLGADHGQRRVAHSRVALVGAQREGARPTWPCPRRCGAPRRRGSGWRRPGSWPRRRSPAPRRGPWAPRAARCARGA